MWKDFKAFIMRGNLVQLAVAFILGVAFTTVVGSFVNDVIMPVVGKLVGKVDFAELYIDLSGEAYESAGAAREAGAPAIYYGAFINTLVNFVIIALVVFTIVRAYQRMERPKEAPPPNTKSCPFCKTAIPIAATRCPNCTSELGEG